VRAGVCGERERGVEGNEVVREEWIFIVSLPLAGSDFRVTTYAPMPGTP